MSFFEYLTNFCSYKEKTSSELQLSGGRMCRLAREQKGNSNSNDLRLTLRSAGQRLWTRNTSHPAAVCVCVYTVHSSASLWWAWYYTKVFLWKWLVGPCLIHHVEFSWKDFLQISYCRMVFTLRTSDRVFLISYHKSVYSWTNLSEADVFRLKTYRGSSLIRIKLRLINFQGPNCGHFQI